MNSNRKKFDCSPALAPLLKAQAFWMPGITVVNCRAPFTHMRQDRLMSQYIVLTKRDAPAAAAPFEDVIQPPAVSL